MPAGAQKIEISQGSNTLIVRVYDDDFLNKPQIESLTAFFVERFEEVQFENITITIIVNRIDPTTKSTVIFIRFNSNNAIFGASPINATTLLSIKAMLMQFMNRIKGVSKEELKEMFSSLKNEFNDLGPITEEANADEILKEFMEEEKNKEDIFEEPEELEEGDYEDDDSQEDDLES